MTAPRGADTQTGFTKPPMLGLHISVWRAVVAALLSAGWIVASWGRLHPVLVALPPIVVIVVAFTTIYHVTLTRWVQRWLSWRRHRRDATAVASDQAALDVPVDAAGDIGVIIENETLITLVELSSDPVAPTVVVESEERTSNTVSISQLAAMLTLTDVKLSSVDVISVGHRAAGGFADLYQQMVGPLPAASHRSTWIVLRIAMADNLGAIARRGSRADAARRTAAVACLRVADALASAGIDARPATAAQIGAVNTVLHAEAPIADHWSHLESLNSFTGIYYADPEHIRDDAAQWWTWPLARDVSTLIRLTRSGAGTQIAALVRYRTAARPPAPPVSRLGPLYGVQQAMWRQFRIGFVPDLAPIPSAPLAEQDPVIAFGPTGPMIGSIGGPREKAAVHMPLVGAITVLCQTPLLLRQVALRATATGRPLIVITDNPQRWSGIVANSAAGKIVEAVPEDVPDDAILVIEGQCPLAVPEVTVLTNDEGRAADVELVDADDQYAFTLNTRSGLSARVRAVPTHEERRLLGVSVSPPPSASRAAARYRTAQLPAGPSAPAPAPQQPTPPAPRPSTPPAPSAPARPQPRADPVQRPAAAPPAPTGNGESGRHRVPAEPADHGVRGRPDGSHAGPQPQEHKRHDGRPGGPQPREQSFRGRGSYAPPDAHPPPPPPPAGPTTTAPEHEDPRWRKRS